LSIGEIVSFAPETEKVVMIQSSKSFVESWTEPTHSPSVVPVILDGSIFSENEISGRMLVTISKEAFSG